MQLSNVLLLALGVAAVAVNPLLDHVAVAISGLFRRLDRSRRRRALAAAARAAANTGSPCGCG